MWKLVLLTGTEKTVEAEITIKCCSTMATRTQTDNRLVMIADTIKHHLGKDTKLVSVR